jgi:hypothetical protein
VLTNSELGAAIMLFGRPFGAGFVVFVEIAALAVPVRERVPVADLAPVRDVGLEAGFVAGFWVLVVVDALAALVLEVSRLIPAICEARESRSGCIAPKDLM